MRLHYKYDSVNALSATSNPLLWEPNESHKHNACVDKTTETSSIEWYI